MGQEDCKNIPHKTKGSMEYKTMGSMGIYKNESMGSMVHSPHKILARFVISHIK